MFHGELTHRLLSGEICVGYPDAVRLLRLALGGAALHAAPVLESGGLLGTDHEVFGFRFAAFRFPR